eukprot:m.243491 g.243491  ORF g.243491 m.243491 type:complete len:277 (-) comp19451_c0_seq2:36-866(-)
MAKKHDEDSDAKKHHASPYQVQENNKLFSKRHILGAVLAIGFLLFLFREMAVLAVFDVKDVFSIAPEAEERYEVLNYTFATMEKYHAYGFMTDGALLGAVRFNHLIPWDHDIEMRMVDNASRDIWNEKVTPELDAKYGREKWRRHIDIHPYTVVGFHEINGCGFNEIGVKSLGGGKKECEERIKQEENNPDREMTAADIVRITMRDPRGYEATVYIPTKPDVWIAKYGQNAIKECVPDAVRYTLKGEERNWGAIMMRITGVHLDCEYVAEELFKND